MATIPLCFDFFRCRVDVLQSYFLRSTISIAVFCLQNLICLLFIFADQVFIDPTFFGIFVCGPLQSFVVNVCTLKTWLKHACLHRSIDVKFIFDSARLGLSSSANILQIADVALRVVFLLFLPCFLPFFRLVLTLETSEMCAIFCFHNQHNSTSSPDLLG